MSTYVMSDIHGCFDLMIDMINKIDLQPDDTLVIAGDYIDRGDQNAEMLEWLSDPPDNVVLLMGNHDYNFAQYIRYMEQMKEEIFPDADEDSLKVTDEVLEESYISTMRQVPIFDFYGTLEELVRRRHVTLRDLKRYADVIEKLPYLYKAHINNQDFIIVHAGYTEDEKVMCESHDSFEDFYIWARDYAYTDGGKRDTVIVAGHTPTISKGFTFNDGKIFTYFNADINCRFFDIDCGAVFRDRYEMAGLACLRLDDMREYYAR